MEERGLIRRERDRNDRRVWRIWLTEAGEQLKDVLPPIAQSIHDRALAGMSQHERETLSQLVDRAIANLS
jgi:DNA-binding MarR family transcriptional regulator